MSSKISKACDISAKVRSEVLNRDGHCCICCGDTYGIQIAHFIPRSRLGLGIPQNLAVLCIRCHTEYDNGKLHKEIQKHFRGHLQSFYENWNEKDLIYSKWR